MEARPLNSEGDEYRECTRCKKVTVRADALRVQRFAEGSHTCQEAVGPQE